MTPACLATTALVEWGESLSGLGAMGRALADRTRPVALATGQYVRAVRRCCGGRVADGRLIAAVWRTPAVRPSEWTDPEGRGAAWLAWWAGMPFPTRPDRVGSSYNPAPAGASWRRQ